MNKPYKPKRNRLENYGRSLIRSGFKPTHGFSSLSRGYRGFRNELKVTGGAFLAGAGFVGRKISSGAKSLLSRQEKNRRISIGLKKSTKRRKGRR